MSFFNINNSIANSFLENTFRSVAVKCYNQAIGLRTVLKKSLVSPDKTLIKTERDGETRDSVPLKIMIL
jgi:hypothetical protein